MVPPVLADAGNIPSYGTLALVLAQWISGHLKGKARDRSTNRSLGEVQTTLTAFVSEQRVTNAHLERRIDAVSALIIGPDGENGARGDLRKVEARVSEIEQRERELLRARDVGAYQPPPRHP